MGEEEGEKGEEEEESSKYNNNEGKALDYRFFLENKNKNTIL